MTGSTTIPTIREHSDPIIIPATKRRRNGRTCITDSSSATGSEVWPSRAVGIPAKPTGKMSAKGSSTGQRRQGRVPVIKRYKTHAPGTRPAGAFYGGTMSSPHRRGEERESGDHADELGKGDFITPKRSAHRAHPAIACRPDAIVLARFAGSARPATRSSKMNADDGGSRRFILIGMEEYASRSPRAPEKGHRCFRHRRFGFVSFKTLGERISSRRRTESALGLGRFL